MRRYETADGLAQVVSHPLPTGLMGWNLYRGPVTKGLGFNVQGLELIKNIINDLKKTKGIFLHLEPNDTLHPTSYTLHPTKNRQPQHTLILDLRKHEELLLSEMHEKTRYNIRLAERHGVIIKENAPPEDFLKLMEETTARDKFAAHSESYYRKMLEEIPNIKLFAAYKDSEPLSAAIVNFFGNTATYLHGASSNEKRNLMAPHLLHWEIMKSAKADGYNFYDFWGIAPESEEDHPWAGITRFKKGFGGEIVAMPQAVELPLRQNFYKMYTLAKKLV